MKRTMIILASALLAVGLFATGAQAGGGGGSGTGGFGGVHMGGFGGHMGGIGGSHIGVGARMASPDVGARRHIRYGLYDGLGCTNYNYNLSPTSQTWPPACS